MQLVFLLLISGAAANNNSAALPPNVLFIVGDDVGYADIGFFNDHKVHTPTLNQLLEDGVFLSDYCAWLFFWLRNNNHVSDSFHLYRHVQDLFPLTRCNDHRQISVGGGIL